MNEDSPSQRRQQQRAIETRNALLAAASAAFSAKGFDGISIRHLEELAGVKRGLVAYHFGDKDSLWRGVADRLFGELAQTFVVRIEALADIAPQEAVRGMVRAFVRHCAAHPELNRLIVQESMSDSWRVHYIVDEHIKPLLENLSILMPELSALIGGQFDAHRYYTFIGASAFVFSAEYECRRLFGTSPRDEAFVERHADHVVALLLKS